MKTTHLCKSGYQIPDIRHTENCFIQELHQKQQRIVSLVPSAKTTLAYTSNLTLSVIQSANFSNFLSSRIKIAVLELIGSCNSFLIQLRATYNIGPDRAPKQCVIRCMLYMGLYCNPVIMKEKVKACFTFHLVLVFHYYSTLQTTNTSVSEYDCLSGGFVFFRGWFPLPLLFTKSRKIKIPLCSILLMGHSKCQRRNKVLPHSKNMFSYFSFTSKQ